MASAAPAAGAPPQAAAPRCDLDVLWDAWVGCIVNSQCFRDAEASGIQGKAALKSCAKVAFPSLFAQFSLGFCSVFSHVLDFSCHFGLISVKTNGKTAPRHVAGVRCHPQGKSAMKALLASTRNCEENRIHCCIQSSSAFATLWYLGEIALYLWNLPLTD